MGDSNMAEKPSIPEYYKGKTIFMTGGSGFMGQALVEKLLYSCTGLEKIYLLIRPKKGLSAEERLKKLYGSSCFDRLKAEKPDVFESKVFAIAGDASELGLGLSIEDRAIIINEVNIIFHAAASVRFDDTLPVAVKLNLRGAVELVELAKQIRKLEAFVHISTCYANCNRHEIMEKIYPPFADWRDLLQICDELDPHTVDVLTQKFLKSLPNTYTYTKQLAEQVIYEQRGLLPLVISRPSIVIASVKEPAPGWVDNFNGPMGLLIASGKGVLRVIYSKPDVLYNYVPLDHCIRHFIVAAWARGSQELHPTDDVPVYNSAVSPIYETTMKELVDKGIKMINRFPFHGQLGIPTCAIESSPSLYYIRHLLQHVLPALFIDLILWIAGRKPFLLKIQRKIYIAGLALRVFMTRQWVIPNDKYLQLRESLKEEDVPDFCYHKDMDKDEYYLVSTLGTKKYLLREPEENQPAADAQYNRMVLIIKILKFILYLYAVWWLFTCSFVQNTISSIIS